MKSKPVAYQDSVETWVMGWIGLLGLPVIFFGGVYVLVRDKFLDAIDLRTKG